MATGPPVTRLYGPSWVSAAGDDSGIDTGNRQAMEDGAYASEQSFVDYWQSGCRMTSTGGLMFQVHKVWRVEGRQWPIVSGVLLRGRAAVGDRIVAESAAGELADGAVAAVEFHAGPDGSVGLVIGGPAAGVVDPGWQIRSVDQ